MRARRLALAWLAAGALATGPAACKPEDPAPFEAEKAKLLAETVPRDDYWKEVERKGTALREQRAAEQRSAKANTERAQIATALEQLRALVADAQRVNAGAAAQIAGLDQQLNKFRAREHALEAYLARTGPPDVGAQPAP